jgi:hypothetical protein
MEPLPSNFTDPKKTSCVTHNGLAINLISTIPIYDKLVIARRFFYKNIYLNVCHVLKEKKS